MWRVHEIPNLAGSCKIMTAIQTTSNLETGMKALLNRSTECTNEGGGEEKSFKLNHENPSLGQKTDRMNILLFLELLWVVLIKQDIGGTSALSNWRRCTWAGHVLIKFLRWLNFDQNQFSNDNKKSDGHHCIHWKGFIFKQFIYLLN